ncbi:MAG: acyl-CoA thioesterase [Muribaculaceae bacterium]|nr:acyl-CoA thioesterase [Bacteroides sp.]MDE7510305.1 acyl-CoA thioesterase [Muribaculaceae bacterium]
MKKRDYCYKIAMEVRDYELDTENIVNNANYLHYMEHTRHKFCAHAGVSFIELQKQGIMAVVRKIEIEYMESLRSGETFISALWLERKGPRFIFHQDILKADGSLVTTAVVTCVMLRDGRLSRGDEVAELFKKWL